jgi:DNA-binding MarR family transcriptional regulator
VAQIDVEQATLANTLARMERDGLIVREDHPSDGRAKIIRLTDKARGLREAATRAAMAQNQLALSGLSEAERKTFINLMQRVIDAMKRDGR